MLFPFYSFSLFATSNIGAVTTGTAGSGRAAVEFTEAPTLNPASIAFMKGYFFTSGYSTFNKGSEFNVSFTDNLPDTVIPSSVIYFKKNLNDVESQKLYFSSGNLIYDRIAFGLGIVHKVDIIKTTNHAQTNLNLGMIATLSSELGLALVVENVIQNEDSIPKLYRLQPSTAVGLSYNFKKVVRFKLDAETSTYSNSFTYPIVSGGIETYWNRWLILRIGARKTTETKVDEYAGGFGFVGPKFAVHYGYIDSPHDKLLTRHAVDLAIPIW